MNDKRGWSSTHGEGMKLVKEKQAKVMTKILNSRAGRVLNKNQKAKLN